MHTFYINVFHLIVVSSTRFEHPDVHPQDDLYMHFYGITFIRPFKFNYSVLNMFRTSRCSSSRRLVHAVLWYYFHASISVKSVHFVGSYYIVMKHTITLCGHN
jgi:hypothetical protein